MIHGLSKTLELFGKLDPVIARREPEDGHGRIQIDARREREPHRPAECCEHFHSVSGLRPPS